MKINRIEWPTVAVLALFVAAFVAVWATAEAPHREEILAGLAVVGPTVLALMRAALDVTVKPPPLPILVALCLPLAACGGSTAAGIAGVISVAKPVAVGICEAARFTEDVCERHGAYGETSGGETP